MLLAKCVPSAGQKLSIQLAKLMRASCNSRWECDSILNQSERGK